MTNRRGIELFARDYPHDYPEVEAILMLHAHRLRIHEVPVRMNARGFGRSSIDYPRSAYYMAKVLLALFVGLFRRRPTPVEATGEDELVGAAGPGRRRRAGARPDDRTPLAASHAVGTKAQIVAVIVAGDLPRGGPRAGPPAPAGRALRAAVDARRGGHAGPRGVARRAQDPRRRGRGPLAAQRPVPDALGVVFVLLLHFSIATSRLSEETKILAQEVARLDAEAKAAREASANGGRAAEKAIGSDGGVSRLRPPGAEQREHQGPVSAKRRPQEP